MGIFTTKHFNVNIQILIITVFFFGNINYISAQKLYKQKHNLNTALYNLKKDRALKNAGIAFYAVDLSSKEVLAKHNQNLALAPASTQKLITTATTLEVLGANYRFKTKIEYTGNIDTTKRVLHGNLIIRGGGDPTLGSKYFTSSINKYSFLDKWASSVKEAGIDSITGYVIGDARIYDYDMVPPTWSWEDMGNYFGAGACGLTCFDNSYTLTFKTPTKIGDTTIITDISPEGNGLTFDNTVVSGKTRSDLSYIFGAPYTYFRYIRGELPRAKNEYEVRGAMPDPAYYLTRKFCEKLDLYNVKIANTPTTFRKSPELANGDTLKTKAIHITYSPKLSEIIKKTNYISINLYAEHLLSHIAHKRKKEKGTKAACKFVENFWTAKGMDTGGMSLNDGCGLSRYNTVTAKQMVFLLDFMKNKSKNFDAFYNSMAIVGKKGTVKYMLRKTSAAGNMRAKSGSIRSVRCYSGYVKTKSGREVAFSIMLNNFNCSSSKARKKIEKVLKALSDFSK